MDVKLKKFDRRGGRRTPLNYTSGQCLLLHHIWLSLGGVTKIAKKLGSIEKQHVANWRNRGGVPLEKLGEVARRLKIDPWGLNFEALHSFYGGGPTWAKVMSRYELPKEAILKIRAGTPPKSYKEIDWSAR